jgi:hypothetical protein
MRKISLTMVNPPSYPSGLQLLGDHGGVGIRALLEQFGDDWLEWIELAGVIAAIGFAAGASRYLDTWRSCGGRSAYAARSCAKIISPRSRCQRRQRRRLRSVGTALTRREWRRFSGFSPPLTRQGDAKGFKKYEWRW